MNKTAIKNFAIWARNKLISDINYRAGLLGIAADGIHSALPQSTGQTQFYDIGTAEPYAITDEQILQRQHLVDLLRQKEKESDYKTAYKYVLEEVAYTWFNRLIAIRFMEVNDYLPSHIRVLSSESGKMEPDLVTTPFDTDLEFNREEQQTILDLKNANKLDEVFRLLFIKQCNALNVILPALFEKTSDYTELLLNLSVIDQDGVIWHLVHDIPESDFNVEEGGQVEMIGWLYQYYNTEPKNEAFAKKGKITKDEVPAVTQLFTPDWIVRYMVENSLGRIYIDKRKNEGIFTDGRAIEEMTWHEIEAKRIANEEYIANEMGWKYYLPEAEQEPKVVTQLSKIRKEYEKLNPEDIKVIDPCMGSGHILVYAFDVLMQIYESAGYGQRDAVRSILENNIYGLDIDDRAFQMAYFAVMMKARQYNRRILNGEHRPNVYSIQESNGINRTQLKYFGKGLNEREKNNAINQIKGLLDTFIDAKEYGSILNVNPCDWDLLMQFVENIDEPDQINLNLEGIAETQIALNRIIYQGKILSQKYEVTITNPPYMAISSASPKLNKYINDNYIGGKTDLFSVFIEKCLQLVRHNCYLSMITMQSWMFLTSFEPIRKKLLSNEIINLVHLGARGFDEISGEVVQTVSFVVNKSSLAGLYKGNYSRLISGKNEAEKAKLYLSQQELFISKGDYFRKVPQRLIAYWVSENTIDCFDHPSLKDILITREGMATADNDRFLRLWQEVAFDNITFDCESIDDGLRKGIKWVPYNKGGTERDWYGNNDYIVDWSNNGFEIRNNKDPKTGRIRSHNYNGDYSFREGATWSSISSGDLSVRFCPKGFLFDSKGAKGFAKNGTDDLIWIIGLLNSKVSMQFLQFISPTLDFKVGDIVSLPYINNKIEYANLVKLIKSIIIESKKDWDSFETSWDFKNHPLVRLKISKNSQLIETAFNKWTKETNERFSSIKCMEEKVNEIFIATYGLQKDLSPEVTESSISIRTASIRREIVSLISYAVGCMLGRYSLDKEGITFAGGEWDDTNYRLFVPDGDNIIPISDEEYLEDDIVSRLCTWIKIVYGEETLEENLDFIAKALGNKGSSSREIIRSYFLNDFFKDHCQTYSVTGSGKRPIYWLFDSGKQNGFKALIYLHRYNADTIGNLRIDYLHRMQRIYESEINRMQDMIEHSTSAREAAQATKRREKLTKQLKECREYDEKLAHLALSRIELDLDDGVKVNYRKLQTAGDGKFYEVLADSKNIMSKK